MRRQQLNFKLVLTCLGICIWLILFPVLGSETQPLYGYQSGDVYAFTDSIIETFDANDTHLLEQDLHSFQVHIQTVEENLANHSILVTIKILNLSAGMDNYIQFVQMEGYTPIVASPFVYFTHTNWGLHAIDFLDSAENYKAATQMTGTVNYDLTLRFFTWNLSKFITAMISPYDVDEDGNTDAYTALSMYQARFTVDGVLQIREFHTEYRFTNGACYCRIRQISLEAPSLYLDSSVMCVIIGFIFTSILILLTLTILWSRHSPTAS